MHGTEAQPVTGTAAWAVGALQSASPCVRSSMLPRPCTCAAGPVPQTPLELRKKAAEYALSQVERQKVQFQRYAATCMNACMALHLKGTTQAAL